MFAAAPAAASDWVAMDALASTDYAEAEAGVVRLSCVRAGEGGRHVSRAVILDAPGGRGDFDVLLASRHAVADAQGLRDCQVEGRGEAGAIVRIHAPLNPAGEFNEDWAVLVTSGPLGESAARLRAAAPPAGLEGEVSLVVQASEERACRLGPGPREVEADHLLFHDCDTRPGLSGSPIVSRIGGEAYVIGLHLGWVQVWRDDAPRYGVARRLTPDLGEALARVIDTETARRGR